MLGNFGLELSLWLWLLNDPEVITAVIIKQTPNGGWCGGPAVLSAAGPASWVAARLGSSGGLRWASAGLLLRPPGGLCWPSAGLVEASCGLRWSPAGLLLARLVSCLLLGSFLGSLRLGRLQLGCLLGCGRLFVSRGWAGLSAQLREFLFS